MPKAAKNTSQSQSVEETSGGFDIPEQEKEIFEETLLSIRCRAQQSQSQLAPGFDGQEIAKLTKVVVRCVLLKNGVEPGVPIKRTEIVELLKGSGGVGQSFNKILAVAKEQLAVGYGLEVKEIAKIGLRGESIPDALLIVRSLVPMSLQEKLFSVENKELKAVGLALVSLMSLGEEQISKELFFDLLEEIGFKPGERHPLFGQWEKTMLESLLKMRYIRIRKTNVGTETYCIGEVAKEEISTEQIEEFIQRVRFS